MKLYDRDYQILSKKEIQLVERIDKKLSRSATADAILAIPNDYYYFTSLFPNNYLDSCHLDEKEKLKSVLRKFRSILNKKQTSERDILTFINSERAYFLVAAILDNYDFGHHGAFLFPEFKLGTDFIADYLLIGKNSGGHEFVFIELETIQRNITTKDGGIGKAIGKGLKQVEDWNHWLQSNFSSLRTIFKKAKHQLEELPEEFYEYDNSRIHFVIVSGRRIDFNSRTYRIRRTKKKESNITILHYDNLIDYVQFKIKTKYPNW